MTDNEKSGNGWTGAMRWAARIVGLVAAGLFVAFLLVSGPRVLPALSWTSPQGIPLLFVLLIALAGVLIAWRWELVGGLLAVAGGLAIMGLVCAGSGIDMLYCAVLFTLPLLLAGVLYLACCARSRAATPA
ncbi:hypothetical protein ACFLWA_02085 [Chloroflexota bacterium]